MSAISAIEWTDRTWNPVRGCSIVSPGCVNCYAMKQAHRFSGPGKPYEGLTKQTKAGPQWTGEVRSAYGAMADPLSWRKPQRVFVNSMSDLFHEGVPAMFIDEVFAVMALAPEHTFQILTKRADRMLAYLGNPRRHEAIVAKMDMPAWLPAGRMFPRVPENWPLPNVWIGVSVEDQQRADERIPLLLQTPAAVRFISAEPLLGPIDLVTGGDVTEVGRINWLTGFDGSDAPIPGLDWVIVGGESGPGARPCHVDWVRSVVEQCRSARVPVFCKQLGSKPQEFLSRHLEDPAYVGEGWMRIRRNATDGKDLWFRNVKLLDRKGGDTTEWPQDLRVRDFPREAVSV